MRRFGLALCLAVVLLPTIVAAAPDPLPIIVTYEMKKQRHEEHLIARDPKAFWVHQVVARLEAKKSQLPKPLKQQATVQVTFVVGHDGNLISEVVSQPSGVDVADHAALTMVDGAKPFPPMPTGMDDKDMTFSIPVRFR